MEKYEFKYYRKAFAVTLIIASFLIVITMQFIAEALMDSSAMLGSIIFFIGGISFVGLALYGFWGANAQGIGILHDEYVEIKLKGKEYKINYSDIVKINEKVLTITGLNRRFIIRVSSGSSIVLRQGSGIRKKMNLYPLENFMLALYKRLKPEQYY